MDVNTMLLDNMNYKKLADWARYTKRDKRNEKL